MKVFIDLGAYDGDTLEEAIELFEDVDVFYAFEPFESSFRTLGEKFGNNPKVVLVKKAASDVDGEEQLFLKKRGAEGHSLCSKKNNVSSESISIESVDFSKYLSDNFSEDDEIILKVNIEGAEYKMFDKMIKDGTVVYIDKIFCEWHHFKVAGTKGQHDRIVKSLQVSGFNITGDNNKDAFVEYVKENRS
jgi:FkbM family methyltransferase